MVSVVAHALQPGEALSDSEGSGSSQALLWAPGCRSQGQPLERQPAGMAAWGSLLWPASPFLGRRVPMAQGLGKKRRCFPLTNTCLLDSSMWAGSPLLPTASATAPGCSLSPTTASGAFPKGPPEPHLCLRVLPSMGAELPYVTHFKGESHFELSDHLKYSVATSWK